MEASNIEAGDGKAFSAKIYLDICHKYTETSSHSIRMQNNKNTKLSGIAG